MESNKPSASWQQLDFALCSLYGCDGQCHSKAVEHNSHKHLISHSGLTLQEIVTHQKLMPRQGSQWTVLYFIIAMASVLQAETPAVRKISSYIS